MNNKWDLVVNQWKRFSVDARKNWSGLTDDDLVRINGSRNSLAGLVQRRYFISKKEAFKQIDEWANSLKV